MGHSARNYVATLSVREDERRELLTGRYEHVVLALNVATMGGPARWPRSREIRIPREEFLAALR